MRKIFRLPLIGTRIAIAQDRHGSAVDSQVMTGRGQFDSQLFAKVIDKNGRERQIYEYFGTRKESKYLGRCYNYLQKLWYIALYRKKTVLDLGSGLTTNVAALATANDWNLASPSGAAINLLKLANYQGTGTGTTAAAATDIKLTTNDAVTLQAGTQSVISAANSQKLQSVATLTGYGTEAVTEWGLHTSATLSTTTGSPFTNTGATSFTATATPFTASTSTLQGLQQQIVVAGTTAVWGYITSNTTSVGTIPAWYKVTDGTAGSTPGTTETYTLRPILYDHKVFSAINTISGDTIQFTYQLTIASGN